MLNFEKGTFITKAAHHLRHLVVHMMDELLVISKRRFMQSVIRWMYKIKG